MVLSDDDVKKLQEANARQHKEAQEKLAQDRNPKVHEIAEKEKSGKVNTAKYDEVKKAQKSPKK